jgi:hypothetical protein
MHLALTTMRGGVGGGGRLSQMRGRRSLHGQRQYTHQVVLARCAELVWGTGPHRLQRGQLLLNRLWIPTVRLLPRLTLPTHDGGKFS